MIELWQDGSVAHLAVRRAEKKYAFTQAMWQALRGHCQDIAAACTAGRPDAPRVLVLQGEPGTFCAGADIEELTALIRDPAALLANNEVVASAQVALERLPVATLAVIDGPCFGGGFGLAAACDFRIGSDRSVFAVTPAKLGLLYSLEDTRRLVRLVGDARTRRLLLRGERLDAHTALQWGVLDAVFEPDSLASAAASRVAELALQSRTSMAGIKATLAMLSGAGNATEAELSLAFAVAFQGPDFAEGAAAFLQRRAARF